MKNYTKVRRLNEHDNSAEWQNDPQLGNILTMTVDSFLDKVKSVDPQKYAEVEQFIKTNQVALNPEAAQPNELPMVTGETQPSGDLQSQVDELKMKIQELEAKLSGGSTEPSTPPQEPSSDMGMPPEEVPSFNQAVNQEMM